MLINDSEEKQHKIYFSRINGALLRVFWSIPVIDTVYLSETEKPSLWLGHCQ